MDDKDPFITQNSHVTVELVDLSGDAERREFTLVPTEQADIKSGLLDENTPLGRLLVGRHAGESLPYRFGDLKEVRILKVASGESRVDPGAAQKRRGDVQKAQTHSEITNQMIFSTASGSKWGEYDVDMDKLLNDEEDKEENNRSG